ncbi:MAG: phosphonopyruvate decarboxylase [Ignavibacteria bacterium]
MITPKQFFETLVNNGITFFTGVPDSLLKDFCAYVTNNVSKEDHIINSNEGAAVALAAGYYLATGTPALVYMQNSGLGNSINPLLSLADPEVYSIPMLLMIGWRGEPGKKDEPQHRKQGRVMLKMLDAMEISYQIINSDVKNINGIIEEAVKFMKEKKSPYALIISEGSFGEYKFEENDETIFSLRREDAIKMILENLNPEDVIISTTGKASREVYEYRKKNNQKHENDFLTVGSMGHSSQIALGIALKKKEKNIYVLDGDGAVIMQMGTLAILGTEAPVNFKHIVINNGAHDSVGGQPTAALKIDISAIAHSCGYINCTKAETKEEIIRELEILKQSKGPSLLEIKVNKGARNDLGRPSSTPIENKEGFMSCLSK